METHNTPQRQGTQLYKSLDLRRVLHKLAVQVEESKIDLILARLNASSPLLVDVRKQMNFEQYLENVGGTIINILIAYYGQNGERIEPVLIASILEAIERELPLTTLEDLKLAYTVRPIIKEKGVGMSVSEFLSPLRYWMKQINSVEATLRGEAENQQYFERLNDESVKVYNERKERALEAFNVAIAEGWEEFPLGAEDALLISAEVSEGLLTIDEKKEILKDVVKRERITKKENDPFLKVLDGIGGNPNKIPFTIRAKCALIVVNKCLKLKK